MFENLGKKSKENNIINLIAFKYVNTFQTKVLNFYCIQQKIGCEANENVELQKSVLKSRY